MLQFGNYGEFSSQIQCCTEHRPTVSISTIQCNVPPTFTINSNDILPFEQKSTNESNTSELIFFQMLAKDTLIILLFRD